MDDKQCVSTTLKFIGSKWTILILRELCEEKKRFGQLHSALSGISPKTLSLRLKELEQNGIVQKKIFAEVPLHVEYALTKKGMSLKEIITKMKEWGEKYD